MKTATGILILVLVSACSASVPFTGPGVNTHGQMLSISALHAIGINWVRCDVAVGDMNGDTIRPVVRYYRDAGVPQLWIIPQAVPNPAQAARDFVHWGITDVEVGNEPDLAQFNPDRRPWSPQQYAEFFREVWGPAHPYVRLYGPSTSSWNPDYIAQAMAAGMQPDGITYHGYHVGNMASVTDSVRRRWGVPAVMSEVGALDNADPVSSYLTWKRQMGSRPWVYYDGPQTDERGLFTRRGGSVWNEPTSVYNRIRSALSG